MQTSVTFIINLLQDINVIRPLAFVAARDLGMPVQFLLSHKFLERDSSGTWRQELQEMEARLGAESAVFHSTFEALGHLDGRRGFIVAGSESNLSAHDVVHNVLRASPPSLTRVTLQHGFECVGFRQSRDQNLAHGKDITFAADIVCGWFPPERMNAMAASQKSKLFVSGPPMSLQTRPANEGAVRDQGGFVCENLHSPRFRAAGDFKANFMENFEAFCATLAREGKEVTLRPHPGGQYVVKNNVSLPENVTLSTLPVYKIELSRFNYGISAPSSILIDMVLAGMPVAVWQDATSVMDLGNYEGLTVVSSVAQWVEFAREATENPTPFLNNQKRFLANQLMPTDPFEVHRRFVELFRSFVEGKVICPANRRVEEPSQIPQRVMFIANGFIPTLQLSFVKPLAGESGIETDFLLEEEMKKNFGKKLLGNVVIDWASKKLLDFSPDLLVFCRYSGPHVKVMTEWARKRGTPVIFHVDDDLLDIPREIGERKHEFHNHPMRLATVRHLLGCADLVYASTERLKTRFLDSGTTAPVIAGKIYASGKLISRAVLRPVRKVGYMASADHAHNLEMILPAVIELLRRHQEVVFEFFGSIPVPDALREFGDRIQTAPPVQNYEKFLEEFASRKWDIGLCPLAPISFNLMKANTKWVEYTSVGAAVIASRDTVYDDCCADGCGILPSTTHEWLEALEKLVNDPQARFEQVQRAQQKLAHEYSTDALRSQVLDVFARAKELTPTLARGSDERAKRRKEALLEL